jgi:hypothetical protein
MRSGPQARGGDSPRGRRGRADAWLQRWSVRRRIRPS